MILPAVSLLRSSPPRSGEYLHEVTAGSMKLEGVFDESDVATLSEQLDRLIVIPTNHSGIDRPASCGRPGKRLRTTL